MWFIFVIPMAVASSIGALLSVTTGMNFVIFAVAATEWQRRRGHRPGEGRFTERENDAYYGVGMDENSDHDLSMDLGRLAHYAPTAFAPHIGSRFDFTKSEGLLLRSILQPAVVVLNEVEVLKEALQEDPQNEDIQQALFAAADNLGTLVNPILTYLELFPATRVKKLLT